MTIDELNKILSKLAWIKVKEDNGVTLYLNNYGNPINIEWNKRTRIIDNVTQ